MLIMFGETGAIVYGYFQKPPAIPLFHFSIICAYTIFKAVHKQKTLYTIRISRKNLYGGMVRVGSIEFIKQKHGSS